MAHDKGKVERSQKLPGDAYLSEDSKNLQEPSKSVSVFLHENEHRTSNTLSPASPSSIPTGPTVKQDQLSLRLNDLHIPSSSSSLAQNRQNYSSSSPQFGDARSSKNETTSEKRTALSPEAHDLTQSVRMMGHKSEDYAENYRGFLLYLLREIWGRNDICSGPYFVENAVNTDDLPESSGLYFMFWSAYKDADDTQDRIYPLYVGITGRTFKERFEEHIKTGVIHKINKHQWPKEKGMESSQVIAYVVKMDLPVAKFFESVFLSAFNFPMNVEENGAMRDEIQITESETENFQDGFNLMHKHYKTVKSQLDNIGKITFKDNIKQDS